MSCWKPSQSAQRPAEIDTTSSKTVNYVRRNINEVTTDDGIVYEYEEMKVHKDDWEIYCELEQAKADIDYLNMITEDL